MSRSSLRAASTALLLLFLLAAPSCGRGHLHLARSTAPQVLSYGTPVHHASAAEIDAALKGLDTLAVPASADAASFAQLKDALRGMLSQRLTAKGSSKLPDQSKNTVADAQVVSDGSGGFNLTWTYKNVGDYDSNGQVNISDLTALGVNLGKNSGSPGWATKAQAADGDGNGLISISDLTPIGANLSSQVTGYDVYSGPSATGPWTFVSGVPLEVAAAAYPRGFTVALGSSPAAFYALAAYDSGDGDWITGLQVPHPAGATVQLGNDVADQSTTVAAGAAGSLTGSSGTPLAGYSVSIPAGAFDVATQVSLGYNDGTVTPVIGTQVGPIIQLTTDYVEQFQKPVQITVPYSGDPSVFPVPFYIDPDLGLRLCNVVAFDQAAQTITFETWHASPYATVVDTVNATAPEYFDTKFDPKLNGFQVANTGSEYNLAGESYGFTSFAGWFYRGYKSENLYDKYMAPVGSSGLTGQDIIVTRAFDSVLQAKNETLPDFAWRVGLPDAVEWALIRMELINTGAPVMLAVIDPGFKSSATVLAIAYSRNNLYVYDPDHPRELQTATYDPSGKFLAYQNYVKVVPIGEGSLHTAEPFYNIKSDADDNFAGSTDAVVTPVSLTDGQTVTQDRLSFSADISSGQVLVDRLYISNDSVNELADVSPIGTASPVTLPIQSGDNYFQLRTTGPDAHGAETEVSNNFTNTRGLHIIGGFGPPAFTLRIDPLTPLGPGSGVYSDGSFELWVRWMDKHGNWVLFKGNAPDVTSGGTGLLDNRTFVVSAADFNTAQYYSRFFQWYVHRYDDTTNIDPAFSTAAYSTALADNRAPAANFFWSYGAGNMTYELSSGSQDEQDPFSAASLGPNAWAGPWRSSDWIGPRGSWP